MILMKKKVKRIVGILFTLCLSACLLTACGGNDKAAESSSETKTEAEITASAKDKKDDSKKEESEKTDKTKDETAETNKTAETKKETSSSNSGSSASKTASSANKSQNSSSNSSASQSSQPSASKPSASSGNSGSASKPSTPAQESKPRQPVQENKPAETQPSEPVHTHTWVWATHTETTPEQSHVVEVKKYVCNNCGQQFDNAHDVGTHIMADFWDNCENYTYKTVSSETVIDVPAQTVTVNDYQYCSICGERK